MPLVPVDPKIFIGQPMILVPTVIGGQTAPGDYVARCAGWTVGRILFVDRAGAQRWAVSMHGPATPHPDPPPSVNAADLPSAKAEIRRMFDLWLGRARAAAETGERVQWYRAG